MFLLLKHHNQTIIIIAIPCLTVAKRNESIVRAHVERTAQEKISPFDTLTANHKCHRNIDERNIGIVTMLQNKARECAEVGSVMGWELGQVVENYLVDCANRRLVEEERRRNDMVKKKRNSGGDDDVIRGGGVEFALLDDVDIDRLNIDDEDGGRNEEARRPPTHKLPPFYGVQEFHANIWHRVA